MNTTLLIIAWLGAGFLFGLLYQTIHKKIASKTALTPKGSNINKNGRVIRGAIGFALILFYFFLSKPVLLFFAGFTFFEAVFSWCGFYALLGKNTCPLE